MACKIKWLAARGLSRHISLRHPQFSPTVPLASKIPYDRGYKRFAGEYQISFVTLTIADNPEGLHLSVPMYGSGIMPQVSDTVFQGEAAGTRVKLETEL